MKRALTLLSLLSLLLCLALAGCGHAAPPVTAEEIFPEAQALLERSVTVNEIFLGDGVPMGNEAFGEYAYADLAWEEREDLHSVEDMLRAAKEVYTDAIYNILYAETITKDGQIPPDYQNRGTPAVGILVYTEREGWYTATTHEYLYDTMVLTAATDVSATVTISVRISPEGQEPQERVLSLPLVKTSAGWRCDKLTCIAYDPSLSDN